MADDHSSDESAGAVMAMDATDLADEIDAAIETELDGLPDAASSPQVRAALSRAIAEAVIAHIVDRAEVDGDPNLIT